jgi:CO/xanthine dehydrogenase Mo-binding subunit
MSAQASPSRRAEAASAAGPGQVDDWLAVEPNGTVVVFSGKVELGTGIRTALAQIVAEELDVPFERVEMVMGDTSLTPDEGYTAGSTSIEQGGSALRLAAAEARRALLEMASDRLDAAPGELAVRDGVVYVSTHPDRAVSYGELAGGRPFHRPIAGDAPLKRPQDYRIVGRPVPRADLPAKVTGAPSFIQDVRVPNMLHGRVVRPPAVPPPTSPPYPQTATGGRPETSSLWHSDPLDSPWDTVPSGRREGTRSATGGIEGGPLLLSLDPASVPYAQVVRLGDFVGVVAEREEDAVRAVKELAVEWRRTESLPPQDELFERLRRAPARAEVVLERGDVEAALRGAATRIQAEYRQPFQAHASIGPSCAVADVRPERATVWSNTQGVYPLRAALADLLDVPAEQVQVIHVEGAGSYGHNGSDDAAADAALLSRAVGRPVRVQWSRQDEFAWEPYAPAMVMEVRGGLDGQGRVVGWAYDVWTPSHVARARTGRGLLAGQLVKGGEPPKPRWFGGGTRNAPANYAFESQRVTAHWLDSSPLRVSAMRSLGAAANTFANESFMDELAAAAGADPLEFRLRHLADARAREVLQAAADRAGWGTALRAGQGRGLAFAWYENDAALVATVAHVQVDPAGGEVRARRLVIAFDCGLIINPDGVRNQVEGNALQSLSRALHEEVTFDRSRITSVDWDTYPILKFSEVPEVEVVLLNRPEERAVGAGEPATITTAAAVANAIYDATGVRVRQVPFRPLTSNLQSPTRPASC